MTGRADASGWTVVVPVKSLAGAKTRLAPELGPAERAALARAFALDTIDAARASRAVRRVVVVTDEPAIELALRGVDGVEVAPEFGPRGLAAAIAHGIAVARAEISSGTAVLLGDLPALAPGDLDAALEAASRHPLAFAADAEGTGTTLATALAGVPFVAHFGPGSAARHRAAGFTDLVVVHSRAIAPSLRRDVDTAAELDEAGALGTGVRTAAVLRALGALPDVAPRHPLDPSTAPPGAATAPHGADRKAAS
ncbi:2-phospho-L-lactate guanylyltransferase [Agromyces sp. ZXT2-3]|uniref:2-phospho-L-lactate guanylyltransferase n=1 Tax=Agromyces sp. ZXT2-3 TaxID=3461152 RepID=UPI004054FD36